MDSVRADIRVYIKVTIDIRANGKDKWVDVDWNQ